MGFDWVDRILSKDAEKKKAEQKESQRLETEDETLTRYVEPRWRALTDNLERAVNYYNSKMGREELKLTKDSDISFTLEKLDLWQSWYRGTLGYRRMEYTFRHGRFSSWNNEWHQKFYMLDGYPVIDHWTSPEDSAKEILSHFLEWASYDRERPIRL